LVTFGSLAFGVYQYYGLTVKQWLICIGFGSSSILINLLGKFIPEEKFFPEAGNK
jgi:Ca2+ transporting ATPase